MSAPNSADKVYATSPIRRVRATKAEMEARLDALAEIVDEIRPCTVRQVFYPGLPSHPQHELACRQMSGFGGMISFDVGDAAVARRVAERTRLFALAESLGGVESLIGHPASMTHASVPRDMREAMGLTDSLLRLSVGIEDPDDLIADLDQALAAG